MNKKLLKLIGINLIPGVLFVLWIFGTFFSQSDSGYGPDYSECEEECGDSRSCYNDCVFDLNITHKDPG